MKLLNKKQGVKYDTIKKQKKKKQTNFYLLIEK